MNDYIPFDMMELDEIEKALRTIVYTCENADGCSRCPLGNDEGECMIMVGDGPMTWEITSPVTRLMK